MNVEAQVPAPPGTDVVDVALEFGRLASEIIATTPETPDWLVPGMLARGMVTEVNGREKVGKGYFETYLVGCLERGEPTVFGDAALEPIRTLIYTEEPEQSLREKFVQFGITDAWIVNHWELAEHPWPVVVDRLVRQAQRQGCTVIFIDNISSATSTEDEAGVELARKVEPLADKAKEHGLAVLYDRHHRKAAGKIEDKSRGSTALAGAVDCIVAIEKDGRPQERRLTSWGRLWDNRWEKNIELTEDRTGYIALEGDSTARMLLEREHWTAKELAERSKRGEDTARSLLREQEDAGLVVREARAGANGADLFRVNQPTPID